MWTCGDGLGCKLHSGPHIWFVGAAPLKSPGPQAPKRAPPRPGAPRWWPALLGGGPLGLGRKLGHVRLVLGAGGKGLAVGLR